MASSISLPISVSKINLTGSFAARDNGRKIRASNRVISHIDLGGLMIGLGSGYMFFPQVYLLVRLIETGSEHEWTGSRKVSAITTIATVTAAEQVSRGSSNAGEEIRTGVIGNEDGSQS